MRLELSIGGIPVQHVDLLNNSTKDEVSEAGTTLRSTNQRLINDALNQGTGWCIVLSIGSSIRNAQPPLPPDQADKWLLRFGLHSTDPLGYVRPF